MKEKITNTEIIANELLLEKYRPIMVVKLSKTTTLKLTNKLKEFALDISDKTGYEVLLFPDEKDTSVNLISVCNTETENIDNLRKYIYDKYANSKLEDTPFTTIKDRIKKSNEEK